MSMARKQSLILVLGLVALILGTIWYLQPSQVIAEQPCPENLSQLPNREERNRCSKEKQVKTERDRNKKRQEREATPTKPPSIPNFKPVKLKPTAEDKKVEQLPLEVTLGGPKNWQGATSIWRAGFVANPTGTSFERFFVFAKPGVDGYAIIETDVMNAGEYANMYRHRWTAPQITGDIIITSVTGPNGTISFRSNLGKSGTLDLAAGKWSFTP